MIYGYARVSSQDQNLDRQLVALTEEGCNEIFEEKISGATLERPQLTLLFNKIEAGDIIIVHSLDRISRSTIDLLSLVDNLREKQVALKSINDNWFDMTEDNPFSSLLLTIMSGLSEYERKMIRLRQQEGIKQAKLKGKFRGRVKKYTDSHAGMNHAIELYKFGNKTVKEICEITKVSKSALYRELNKQQSKKLIATEKGE